MPKKIGYPLSKWPTSWPENMGEPPYVFMAQLLGQEAALRVFRAPNWNPGEAAENNFNAACGLGPLCRVRGRLLFGLS